LGLDGKNRGGSNINEQEANDVLPKLRNAIF